MGPVTRAGSGETDLNWGSLCYHLLRACRAVVHRQTQLPLYLLRQGRAWSLAERRRAGPACVRSCGASGANRPTGRQPADPRAEPDLPTTTSKVKGVVSVAAWAAWVLSHSALRCVTAGPCWSYAGARCTAARSLRSSRLHAHSAPRGVTAGPCWGCNSGSALDVQPSRRQEKRPAPGPTT